MEQPKVIIYMSCYNHEKYVKESLDSIVNQTYKNWELYIVNDGSTDNTGKIIETYTDPRIFYYDFKENTAFIGAANFLQNLILDVEGKYIATSSSDDKWELDKLEKQVEILEKHPEYKSCFTWDKIILEDENDLYYKNHMEYSHKSNRNRYDWLRLFLNDGNCLNACSMLMEKQTFYELGRMNENYRQIGDFRLWLCLASKYPFYVLEEEKTYYRRHSTNLSKISVEVMARDRSEFYETYYRLFKTIDEKTFVRSFYKDMPYGQLESEEDFLAAKFILLVNTYERAKEQVAISIYLENCENQNFLKVLENKYYFKPQNFIHLSGNGGLSYSLLDAMKAERQSSDDGNRFTPAYILLNTMNKEAVKWDDICQYRYSALADLGNILQWGNNFLTVKQKLDSIRMQASSEKTQKSIVVMIGEETDFTIEEIKNIIGADTKCFVSVIPTTKKMYSENEKNKAFSCQSNDVMKEIVLYDESEHCLRFLDELDIVPDVIYYVDCMDERYSCLDMLEGYLLSVEQNAILRKCKCEQNQNWMKLLTHIYEQ